MKLPAALVSLALLAPGLAAAAAEGPGESAVRGEALYQKNCQICHQPTGLGVPDVFPPLADSDFLRDQRERSIRALCEGLKGKITVNGRDYQGQMPAQPLDDAAAADVLNFIGTSFGNKLPAFTPGEVAAARLKSKFPTYEKLLGATTFAPLPSPPSAYALREVARLPEDDFGTRMTGRDGRFFILGLQGSVYRLDPAAGTITRVLQGTDYLDPSKGNLMLLGITLGPDGRLWLTSNQEQKRPGTFPLNEVVIWRTPPLGADGVPGKPEAWYRTTYPHGGGFNHGVSHIAFGPDGLLYVASGARTDGGEKSPNHPDSPVGENEATACLWRLDPKAAEPSREILARGLRNPHGFAWDGSGQLFSFTNGPDANAPEEMDLILPGHHYGFPYQFSDWPLTPKPYPHTPEPPAGLTFDKPVKNLGPAGGAGLSTFDPHSSPAGSVWCGGDFPEPLRNSFLVTRFGNLLGKGKTGLDDSGFDVLSVKPERAADGSWTTHTTTVLAPAARPIDALITGPGTVLILEYTRPINFKDGLPWLPGRILELRAKPE